MLVRHHSFEVHGQHGCYSCCAHGGHDRGHGVVAMHMGDMMEVVRDAVTVCVGGTVEVVVRMTSVYEGGVVTVYVHGMTLLMWPMRC